MASMILPAHSQTGNGAEAKLQVNVHIQATVVAPEVATRKVNVSTHWEACGDDIDAQSEFIKQIVERVNVEGDQVMARVEILLWQSAIPDRFPPQLADFFTRKNHAELWRSIARSARFTPRFSVRFLSKMPKHIAIFAESTRSSKTCADLRGSGIPTTRA